MRRLGAVVVGIVTVVAIVAGAPAARAAVPVKGSFTSSDPLLDRIWTAGEKTAADMVSAPVRLDPRGCPIPAGVAKILLDGVVRDRCPYIGDEAVIDNTLLVASPDASVEEAMLRLFASLQHPDGAIPASPLFGGSVVLVDYSAYFVLALHDVVLRTGDLALGRGLWHAVTGVLDRWYPAQLRGGLVAGTADYGYIERQTPTAAYYSALYAYALDEGAELAGWLGEPGARVWRSKAAQLDRLIGETFWDGHAFTDAPASVTPQIHPEDAGAFAALAGAGTAAQRSSTLLYDGTALYHDYGNGLVDSEVWDSPSWGYWADLRVYPFIGYFDALARFKQGLDKSAFDLIRREWGYMVKQGPGTMWETIGPYGGRPVDKTPSYDSGWSSGAAPLLTSYVLGVRPTSPGYATFDLNPHTGDLRSAAGVVPTPHGPIRVSWHAAAATGVRIDVTAPPGTVARVYGRRPVLVRGHAVVVLK